MRAPNPSSYVTSWALIQVDLLAGCAVSRGVSAHDVALRTHLDQLKSVASARAALKRHWTRWFHEIFLVPGLTKKFRHVILWYGAAVFFERMRLLRSCKLTKTFCKLVTSISCFWALLQVRKFFSLSYCCSEGHAMLICKLLWILIFSGHKIQGYYSFH